MHSISIMLTDDLIAESSETFYGHISTLHPLPSNVNLEPVIAVATIFDNGKQL